LSPGSVRLQNWRNCCAAQRERIYEPALVGRDPRYQRYHADLFTGDEISCWEKHQVELEISRAGGRAA